MKKIVLGALLALALTSGGAMASAAPAWMNGVSLGVQTGVTPDHGNVSLGGVLSWQGLGLGLYGGGHHDANRRSGYGADLHIDFDQALFLLVPNVPSNVWIGTSDSYGQNWRGGTLGLYGDMGIYVQRGDSTGVAQAAGVSGAVANMTTSQTSNAKGELAGGGGIHYRSRITGPAGKYVDEYRIGVGYHTARGIVTTIGVSW